MHITAKVDYAVRAVAVIGAAGGTAVTADRIAEEQSIPLGFLRGILTDLRRSGLITSQQGAAGGFRLAHAASDISVADVIRAVEGPLAEVRGERPEKLSYPDSVASLQHVWIAVRASLRDVLDGTSIADIVSGQLPDQVRDLAANPAAWQIIPRR